MSNKTTIKSVLEMIDARIAHIEDMTADNRSIIIKLVKQSNKIVEFLNQVEIEDITGEFENIPDYLSNNDDSYLSRTKHIKELIDEFILKSKELQDFEKELKKNKDKLTPGQVGES